MLKTLWIMRHGLAEKDFDTDFNRALSSVGENEAKASVSKMLVDTSEKPTRLLVSPFRRTQETAAVVERLINQNNSTEELVQIELEEMLVHFADHQLLANYLLSLEEERIMIVSHMPIVARLCQALIVDCDIYGFQTAQIVKIDFDDQQQGKVVEQYYANN